MSCTLRKKLNMIFRLAHLALALALARLADASEQHIKLGTVVYAGVDYQSILRSAEQEPVDIVLFDGGNNDTPFFNPDLWICIADPHRLGHESSYYPGDLNFRMADVIVINKANTAPEGSVDKLKEAAQKYNPKARVYVTDSEVTVDLPDLITDKQVLLVEDGPTLTHGGMPYGAGKFAADKHNAHPVDPRPYLVGSLADVFAKFPKLGKLLPAMGYWKEQVDDLERTIAKVPCEAVVIATPMDLRKVVKIDKPCAVVTYEIVDRHGEKGKLSEEVEKLIAGK